MKLSKSAFCVFCKISNIMDVYTEPHMKPPNFVRSEIERNIILFLPSYHVDVVSVL